MLKNLAFGAALIAAAVFFVMGLSVVGQVAVNSHAMQSDLSTR